MLTKFNNFIPPNDNNRNLDLPKQIENLKVQTKEYDEVVIQEY